VHPCKKLLAKLPHPDEGKIYFNTHDAQEALRKISDRMEIRNRILSARHVLRGRQKKIFNLHFNDALSNRQIVSRLKIAESTVRYHMLRAYKNIAAYLDSQSDD
jgi:DNA-directed RNA polymerase specialized sigma subunit